MQVNLVVIMLEVQKILFKHYTNVLELFKHVIIHTS